MDELKELTTDEFRLLAAEKAFEPTMLAKDYYITVILYLIKDIKGIYFKGGTALQKTILGHSRLSEDIDFTLVRDLNLIKKEIIQILNDSKLFGKITLDKNVDQFTRLVVPYNAAIGNGIIFIDLNERAKLMLSPETRNLDHFYSVIPKFSFPCLAQREMVAEKVAAAIGRNKPRDHYDIYQIIRHKVAIDMPLVKAKCMQSGDEPSILKMFNRAKKLHKRWNEGMRLLLAQEVSFNEVMTTLAKHFNLKEEKRKVMDKKLKHTAS